MSENQDKNNEDIEEVKDNANTKNVEKTVNQKENSQGENRNENEGDKEVKEEVKETSKDSSKELEELNDRYKRLFAEFENYKKRTQKESLNKYAEITGDVVSKVLPVLDNLEKAATARTDDKNYQDGIKLVVRQFSEALEKLGMVEIETVGKRFDPELHEAVSHVEDPEKEEQEIVQEYRKGYRIGNKVIRHSMVIVAN